MPTPKALPGPVATAASGRRSQVKPPAKPPTRKLVPSRKPPATRKGSPTRTTAVPRVGVSKEKVALRKPPARRTPFPVGRRRVKKKRQGVPDQPRYRRVKVVRPCAVRLAFLLPLAIIAIERYLGFVINLDDVRDVYYDQMGIDPWEFPPTKDELVGNVDDLANLTLSPQMQCPYGQRRMLCAHNPQFYGLSYRKVPNIVHQAAHSRCLTRNFDRASIQWAFRRSSYYIHDMNAVKRLVHSNLPEFPQLRLISESCLPPPLLFGLWKYIVLWVYGGIVPDLNTFPNQFNVSTIGNEDDGFFLLEEGSGTLTTLVMAISPRHPLMYYAIQHSISNILKMRPNVMYSPRDLVGEGALNQAMTDFCRGKEKHRLFKKNVEVPLSEGVWEGKFGRSIRIGGRLRGPNDEGGIISPIFISKISATKELEKIGMKTLDDAIPGFNCVGNELVQG